MLSAILSSVIPTAYAAGEATPASQQGGGLSFVLMFAVFFVFMYFAIWRPQSKRDRAQRALISGLSKGDEVVMVGGLLGRIAKLNDTHVTLTIANGVDMIMQKSSVVSVMPKGTLKSLE